jgi:hypothetical protein
MTTSSTRAAWRIAAATLLGATVALTACGSDDEGDAAADDTGAASDDGTSTTTTGAPAEDGVVEVELVDFAFEGLPDAIAAGTRLTITNSAEVELHKLSALPIAEDEERPVEELLALPGEELAAILRVRPATVLVAAPGGPQVDEVGDGTLSTPGRYLIICAIPLGLDPDAYLDSLPNDGRPQMTGGGRPHFTLGMVTELVVE